MKKQIENIRMLCLINSKVNWSRYPELKPEKHFRELYKMLTRALIHNEIDKQQATCPEASKGCKPHGWPKGNPKWR